MKKLKMISEFLISALFLYLAFRRIDLCETLGVIFSVNIYFVLLSLTVSIAALFVRSRRWKIFLGHEEKTNDIRVSNFFEATCVGQMINNLLLFRMGDFGQAVFLAVKNNLSKSVVFSTVIMERLVDIFPPMVILFTGSFFVLLPRDIGKARVFITMCVIVTIVAAILIFQSKLRALLKVFRLIVNLENGLINS
ncbi:MAG: lysylphosphatidylglycerol synthase transmembrane domain-containing protein [Elusimicrobiota bacterium]